MWLYFCREAPFTSQLVYKQLVSCAHFSLHVDGEFYNHLLHRTKSSSVSEPAPVMAQGLDGNQPNLRLATDFTTFTLSQNNFFFSVVKTNNCFTPRLLRTIVWLSVCVSAALCQRGAQDCWELPRSLHRREGLRLQGLHLPPHHPSVHVPGDGAMRQSLACARVIFLFLKSADARSFCFICNLIGCLFRCFEAFKIIFKKPEPASSVVLYQL